MTKPYRVYKRGENRTFFQNEGDGLFCCTHGEWRGEHIEPASLKHARGEAVYDSYEDLTEEEYEEQFLWKFRKLNISI